MLFGMCLSLSILGAYNNVFHSPARPGSQIYSRNEYDKGWYWRVAIIGRRRPINFHISQDLQNEEIVSKRVPSTGFHSKNWLHSKESQWRNQKISKLCGSTIRDACMHEKNCSSESHYSPNHSSSVHEYRAPAAEVS